MPCAARLVIPTCDEDVAYAYSVHTNRRWPPSRPNKRHFRGSQSNGVVAERGDMQHLGGGITCRGFSSNVLTLQRKLRASAPLYARHLDGTTQREGNGGSEGKWFCNSHLRSEVVPD